MTTRTATITTTHTQTATWLAEVFLSTMADILSEVGIDLTTYLRDWSRDEAALQQWIAEQSLDTLILECHRPDGTVGPVIEFPVQYKSTGVGDAEFTAHRAAMARFRAKLTRVPRGTTYRLFCTFRTSTHTPMPGWSAGQRASTAHLQAMSLGPIANAPGASASMRYLR